MTPIRRWLAPAVMAAAMAAPAAAQDPLVYPAQGQSAEQTEKDKFECYQWAKQNTGFDPMQASSPSAGAQGPAPGGVVGGAAKGAVSGAIIGAIAGDAGKGAAIGAAGGGLFGGMRRHDHEQRQAAAEQQQAAQYSQQRNTYTRAYAACLEGRGYSVK